MRRVQTVGGGRELGEILAGFGRPVGHQQRLAVAADGRGRDDGAGRVGECERGRGRVVRAVDDRVQHAHVRVDRDALHAVAAVLVRHQVDRVAGVRRLDV